MSQRRRLLFSAFDEFALSHRDQGPCAHPDRHRYGALREKLLGAGPFRPDTLPVRAARSIFA